MLKIRLITLCLLAIYLTSCNKSRLQNEDLIKNNNNQTELEIRAFLQSYANHLLQNRKDSIANLYDTNGFYFLENGHKEFISFEESKNYYLKVWTAPKSVEWKDISIEVISPAAGVVTAILTIDGITNSYTGFLVKKSDRWYIRVENVSFNPTGYSTKTISGSISELGLFKYLLTAKPGASISAHLHSADMHIKVISGEKYIIIGNLENSSVQRFGAGNSFTIPANTWHLEWWEKETVEEIRILAPFQTQNATPLTPRNN